MRHYHQRTYTRTVAWTTTVHSLDKQLPSPNDVMSRPLHTSHTNTSKLLQVPNKHFLTLLLKYVDLGTEDTLSDDFIHCKMWNRQVGYLSSGNPHDPGTEKVSNHWPDIPGLELNLNYVCSERRVSEYVSGRKLYWIFSFITFMNCISKISNRQGWDLMSVSDSQMQYQYGWLIHFQRGLIVCRCNYYTENTAYNICEFTEKADADSR